MKPGESFTSERANPALHIILHPPSHRTRDRDHVSQLTLMKLRETGLSLSLSLSALWFRVWTHINGHCVHYYGNGEICSPSDSSRVNDRRPGHVVTPWVSDCDHRV